VTQTPLPEIAQYPSLTQDAMQALARKLALLLGPGDTVTLSGEVGAGKTTFARALIHAIAPDKVDVTSPTFALMQPYDVMLQGARQVLWHLDLYRIEEPSELAALGLEEILGHLVLVEWPEVAEGLLPEDRLDVRLAFGASQSSRNLTFHGNDAWRQRLKRLT
jgi:tRNA threonylcarbamoyl adenosine modification protein YjeE